MTHGLMNLYGAFPLLAAGLAAAQFVPTPTDLTTKEGYAGVNVRYKQVPEGICEMDPNVKSYSGYADVEDDQHVFWWFFEARNQDPHDAPLTVWINGGPGASSMIGLFQEVGPCGIGSDLKPFNNPYSWTNASNMLFIDQPATVGFSYTTLIQAYVDEFGFTIQLPNATCPEYAEQYETCGTYSSIDQTLIPNTTAAAAPNMWKTIQGFMGAFPEYARHGFNFATESYGGQYGPVFNAYFLEQNEKNISGAHKIELENVFIGNGWFDPIIQYSSYYNISVSPGNPYDIDPYNASVKAEWYNNLYGKGNCYDQLKECYANRGNVVCARADNFCSNKVGDLYVKYSGRNEYDMRYLDPDPFPQTHYIDYLNKPEVVQAIGGHVTFYSVSDEVRFAFANTGASGRGAGAIEASKELLAAGVQLTLLYGDADYLSNIINGQVVADEIAAPGYDTAGYVNISTSDQIVHGQVRQSGLFSFLRIYEAGHEVPFFQPLVALEVFERILKRVDLATGKDKVDAGYQTVGTPTSTYREGNGTVQFQVTPPNATYNTTLNAPNP